MTNHDKFHVKVEYSSRGVEVTGRRLHETACSQTISKPSWILRQFGITFEHLVRVAIKRIQCRCDELNKQLDEAREVCKTVEKQS